MNRCVICSRQHTNTWTDGPNMYCEYCEPVRETYRGVASLIVPHLYLGDMKVASGYGGARMCVHEDGPEYEGQCYFLPILITKPNSKLDRTGAVASLYKIGDASNIIDQIVKSGQDILVHCQGGIERSPLVVAWYLTFKAKMFDTLFDAYLFLKMRRPVVSNRLSWLP